MNLMPHLFMCMITCCLVDYHLSFCFQINLPGLTLCFPLTLISLIIFFVILIPFSFMGLRRDIEGPEGGHS